VGLRLAAALGRFWYVRGYLSEGLDRLLQATARAGDGDPQAHARALRAASAIGLLRGDYSLAEELAQRALELYETAGDAAGVARCLSNLGAILHAQNRLDDAAATLDECIAACEEVGDDRLTALARNNRGDVALSQGDLDAAAVQFAQSLELLRSVGDVANVARALYNLGAVALEQDRLDDAGPLLLEALDLSREIADDEDTAWCLIALAAVAADRGRDEEGARLLGFASMLLDRIGATMKPFEQRLFDRTEERLLARLGEAPLGDAQAEGRGLPIDGVRALSEAVASWP
jgi:tetratricopeptide (TPR) repeat protein